MNSRENAAQRFLGALEWGFYVWINVLILYGVHEFAFYCFGDNRASVGAMIATLGIWGILLIRLDND
jgi:hypothetical protein